LTFDDYRTFLDKLAALEGSRISVYVGRERSGSAPVVVVRGVAGPLDMSYGWAGDDEMSSIAFLPVGEDDQSRGPYGPPGLLLNRDIYEQGAGDANTLIVRLGGVYLNIVREKD
jgi:hypothetical protein